MDNKIYHGPVVLILLGMLVLLSGCGETKAKSDSGAEATLEKLRIGADSGTFSLQFRVAEDKGLFEKYGIDAEISTFSFGIDTLNAVLTDRVDIGHAMDYATLTALGKADLKVFSLISSPRQSNQVLFAKEGLRKPEDLIGKKLGVQKGTVNEYIWGKYFETFHIDHQDVTLIPLQSAAEILTAFERGDIQAAWFSGAFIEKAAKIESSRPLNDLSAINFRMRGFLVGKGKLAQEKPQVIVNFHKALAEASQYIVNHPEEAADIAFKELKLPTEAVLAELKRDWEFEDRFLEEDLEHLEQIKKWSIANDYLKDDYSLNDKLDLEGLREAFPDKVTIQ